MMMVIVTLVALMYNVFYFHSKTTFQELGDVLKIEKITK